MKLPEVNREKKLRIMVNTNAPWAPSGYGQQAKQFMPKMVEAGYDTACIAFYGLQGGIINLDGIWFYPGIGHAWGEDAMIKHSDHFKPDVMFTLQDIWVLSPPALKALADKGVKWIPIVPIDHEPTPDPIMQRLKLAYRVVTYSKFGYEELKRLGMHSTFIPHTVPTKMFKKKNKKEIRKRLGIPEDMFIFGMVAANKDNPPRKSFQEVMDAFKMFNDKHPNSGIYFHSYISTDKGFPIDVYSQKLGIAKNIFHPTDYDLSYMVSQEDMADVYSLMDVLLAPSLNEGFGVPIIEAQSCEVPVICNDFTAMRDLVEDGVNGYKTKVASLRFDPLQSYVGVPDTQDLYEKMEKIYTDDRETMGKNARKFVVDNFELELVWKEKWLPFLKQLEDEIHNN